MLHVLQAKSGWPRALALVLMLAFSLGLVHSHVFGSGNPGVQVALEQGGGHDGHDHDKAPDGPSAAGHCGFCAAVAGKLYLPSNSPHSFGDGPPVWFSRHTVPLHSACVDDLLRPPTITSSLA